jgi:hypothetical protein
MPGARAPDRVAELPTESAVPDYPSRQPDEKELRAREREMHEAQMREEARQREETAVREEPRQEPVRQEPVHAEPAPASASVPALVRVDPKVILERAGLQMVETNPTKARQPLPEPEPLQLGRPRRDKPVEQQPASEELVQIETRK